MLKSVWIGRWNPWHYLHSHQLHGIVNTILLLLLILCRAMISNIYTYMVNATKNQTQHTSLHRFHICDVSHFPAEWVCYDYTQIFRANTMCLISTALALYSNRIWFQKWSFANTHIRAYPNVTLCFRDLYHIVFAYVKPSLDSSTSISCAIFMLYYFKHEHTNMSIKSN